MDATAPISVGAASVRWISPAWPADHLDDGYLVLGGHIAGAVTLPSRGPIDGMVPRQLRSLAAIRTAARAAGAAYDRARVCSCGSEATNELLIPRHLLGYLGSTRGRSPKGSATAGARL